MDTPLGAKLAAIETHVKEARLNLILLEHTFERMETHLLQYGEFSTALTHLRRAIDLFDGKDG